jgi:hypothetical protein
MNAGLSAYEFTYTYLSAHTVYIYTCTIKLLKLTIASYHYIVLSVLSRQELGMHQKWVNPSKMTSPKLTGTCSMMCHQAAFSLKIEVGWKLDALGSFFSKLLRNILWPPLSVPGDG